MSASNFERQRRLRVLMLTEFPFTKEDERLGGIMQSSFRLVKALAALKDREIELHVVTETSRVSTPTTQLLGDGVSVLFFPRSKGFLNRALFGYPNARRALAYAIGQVMPDLVHAQGTANYLFAAVRSKVPHILTVHGIYRNEMRVVRSKPGIRGRIARYGKTWLEEIYSRRTKNLIAITEEVASFVGTRSPRSHIYRIDNTIDEEFFRIPPIQESAEPTILFVAAITYRKGLDYLLAAFVEVLKRMPEARLRIAGIWHWDLEYVRDLQGKFSAYIERGQVSFLGGISQADLLLEMEKACLLCLPSRAESAPLVISQAMAAGRPVVASRVGGIPGMVDDGITGRLWPLGDIKALAELLTETLEDLKSARDMGGAARAIALERYSSEAVAKKTLLAYLRASVPANQ